MDGVADAVRAAMHTFEAAERAVDAEALIGHLAPVPEFHMYNDGQRLGYDALTGAVRNAFLTLRSIEGGFSDLTILVLAPDAALATASFSEALTMRDGQTIRQQGAASWLWRRLDGAWRIVYGHVDHSKQ